MFSNRLETELRHRVWIKRLRVVVVVAAVFAAPFAAFEGWRASLRLDPEWRYVEDVLLGWENRGENSGTVRWAKSPTIAVVGASLEDYEFVYDAIGDLNEILAGGNTSVRLVRTTQGDITMRFVPRRTFDTIAEELGRRAPPSAASGVFYFWRGDEKETVRSQILVGSDLDQREREATIIHEVAHSMGMVGHTPDYRESSIFHRRGQLSTAIKFPPIDAKLIRFLYARLRPSAEWWEVRRAFAQNWSSD